MAQTLYLQHTHTLYLITDVDCVVHGKGDESHNDSERRKEHPVLPDSEHNQHDKVYICYLLVLPKQGYSALRS